MRTSLIPLLAAALLWSGAATAQEQPAAAEPAAAEKAAEPAAAEKAAEPAAAEKAAEPAAKVAAPAAPPPSVPWLMRPVMAGTSFRLDTSVALFDGGHSQVLSLSGGYRLLPEFAIGLRLTGISNSTDATSGVAIANPALTALWTPSWGLPVRFSFFGAFVAPLGQGGDEDFDPDTRAAALAGVQNRSGMDNALFQTSYLTGVGGLGLSWHHKQVTIAAEATVLRLILMHDIPGADKNNTNFTSGFHLGWAFWGPLNLSAELHYQRWLSTPAIVEADDTKREQLTWLLGLRSTFKLGGYTLRPGLSYSQPIDKPMSDGNYHIVQFDMPIAF